MDQITLGLDPPSKKTRKEVFLDEMNLVVPWPALIALIQPHARGAHQALGGWPPFPIETMLRIHCLQLWCVGADPNLSHRADQILSQGWKPTLRGSAVDKCRFRSASLTSSGLR